MTTPTPVHPERKKRVRQALTFFSITAYVTGVMLLILCGYMIVEYGFKVDVTNFKWIPVLHGWCYLAFAAATLNLGTKANWSPKAWILTLLGGVVPFLSFFVEADRRKQVTERFQLAEA